MALNGSAGSLPIESVIGWKAEVPCTDGCFRGLSGSVRPGISTAGFDPNQTSSDTAVCPVGGSQENLSPQTINPAKLLHYRVPGHRVTLNSRPLNRGGLRHTTRHRSKQMRGNIVVRRMMLTIIILVLCLNAPGPASAHELSITTDRADVLKKKKLTTPPQRNINITVRLWEQLGFSSPSEVRRGAKIFIAQSCKYNLEDLNDRCRGEYDYCTSTCGSTSGSCLQVCGDEFSQCVALARELVATCK